MAAGSHFAWQKITFDLSFFHKMAAGDHFGWPKITFELISRHFRSICNFYFIFFTAGSHFGWPKITFDRISPNFRSILNFFSSQNGCRRPFWMTENHFRSHFLPFQINMQFWFFFNFHKMAAGSHFGWPKINFDRISRYFRSIRTFDFFFTKWLTAAILDDRISLLIAFLAISDQCATFCF